MVHKNKKGEKVELLIKQYDKSNFRESIYSIPKQLQQGTFLTQKLAISNNFDKIVISGMGGSALVGDLLKVYLNETDHSSKKNILHSHPVFQTPFFNLLTNNNNRAIIRICQNRTYNLPREAYNKALNIICSYSGNTEETVSSLKEVVKMKLPAIGISTGGEVENICRKNNIPFIKLPKPSINFQPRIALGYFTAVILQILRKANKISTVPINSVTRQLQQEISHLEKLGYHLSKKLIKKTPLVYSGNEMRVLAMIWKINFNENSKIPSFWNYFSELNHNELAGFENTKDNYHILILQDKKDNKRILKRYNLTLQFLAKKSVTGEIIRIPNGNILYKLFYSIILANWTSFYLALRNKIDPTPVAMIENFKEQLNKI